MSDYDAPIPHSEYPQPLPEQRPDVYSNSWYREQFRGVMHSLNRCNAEYESMDERVVQLSKLVADMVLEIGKLNDRLDRAAEAVRKLKNVE